MTNTKSDKPHRDRCPNVRESVPSEVTFCNYTDCRGCTDQRNIRCADMPEPTVSEDDWAMDQNERDPDAAFAYLDGFCEPVEREYAGPFNADLGGEG